MSNSLLPNAVGALREARRKKPDGNLISISGADPLNLVGILTPGPKLAALTGNRLLYRDGLPVALLAGWRGAIHRDPRPCRAMGGPQGPAARGPAGTGGHALRIDYYGFTYRLNYDRVIPRRLVPSLQFSSPACGLPWAQRKRE